MRYSVESHASKPISVGGLFLDQLPISRKGATDFTYSRFLVPWLMDYEGLGLFCDEDQVMVGDVWELFSYCKKSLPSDFDVAVVKKQPEFEWSSVMVFNCSRLEHMTPAFVEDTNNRLFDFAWAKNVVELPQEWNHFVGNAEAGPAKLYHYSRGIPYWPETRGNPEDAVWFEAAEAMRKSGKWVEFHRNTIHFEPVMKKFLLDNYGLNVE